MQEYYELPRREREIGNKAPGRFSVVRSEGLRPNFAQLISIFPSGELTSALNFQGNENECNSQQLIHLQRSLQTDFRKVTDEGIQNEMSPGWFISPSTVSSSSRQGTGFIFLSLKTVLAAECGSWAVKNRSKTGWQIRI